MREAKHLGQLNPQAYFCSCKIFPANEDGICDHWPDRVKTPVSTVGSRTRHYLILTGIGLIAVSVFLFGLLMAAK